MIGSPTTVGDEVVGTGSAVGVGRVGTGVGDDSGAVGASDVGTGSRGTVGNASTTGGGNASVVSDDVGFGGSGTEGVDTNRGRQVSQAETENARLRQELQLLNAELTRSREVQELSAERLQQLNETTMNVAEQRRADAQEKARVQEERLSAIQSARDALSHLRFDALYDSSVYANAIDSARSDVGRAVQLGGDVASSAAQREVEFARDAFVNDDLDRMVRHANAAIQQLNRAATAQ